MTGLGFVLEVIIVLLLSVLTVLSDFPTAICITFAVVFWGSLALLILGIPTGVIMGSVKKSRETRDSILHGACLLCAGGLLLALIIFLIAVFVDSFRIFASWMGLTDEAGIEIPRLFFPWSLL
ncbi:MAG: hypothetical protein HFE85_03145 [Clostridiales bacterium]|nr:hypothetical protein [Clostridiales bacterium]